MSATAHRRPAPSPESVAELRAILDRLPDEEWPAAVAAIAEALARRFLTAPPPAVVPEALLDAEALAADLGVPASHVGALARAGRIPVVRLGRYVRFDRAAVRAALAETGASSGLISSGSETKPCKNGHLRRAATGPLLQTP